ncbi:DUF3152 domain-containing protein [Streptomyces lunaelactis]|uniref:DUF3152 domain-containing protein n=1 Tax=Streptomyces lunaelactis TaxID=1535768 RepID=UPI0028168A22|nr:DUF3152 domain-containing protein [Streptomyces lunaelactis]
MGKRATTRRGRSRISRINSRRSATRRPLVRILLLGAGLAVASLGVGAALAHRHTGPETVAGAADGIAPPDTDPLMTPDGGADPAATPSAPARRGTAPSTKPPKPSRPSRPTEPVKPSAAKKTPPAEVPASGKGTFTTAQASGRATGSGPLRRYRVQVEDGVDLSVKDAAAEIQQILAHPRGWAAHGKGSFQLVASDADFVIRIATPDTADRLCLEQGLDTHGQLNCETVDGVVVNLRRWLLGSPTFDGPAAEYRHLIINHEVGHEIGLREHLGCGGPGEPAPVMMQQIKGLDGCRSNAWPYDEDGTYITGPTL